MKKRLPFYCFLITCLLNASLDVSAQCDILNTAVEYPLSLRASTGLGGTENRTGIAYNPIADLYYSVNAGSASYPLDTYDGTTGAILDSIVSNFDYRGAWWNPATSQFEGNGFATLDVIFQVLDNMTAYPTGMITPIFAGNQPYEQSVGDLDYDSNELIYYYDGSIYRYDRDNNMPLGSYTLNNLPVTLADINANSVAYTGCQGKEIGIYDYINQRVLLFNKTTGDYTGSSQLPAAAPQPDAFGVSYTNDLFWIFGNGAWTGYEVVSVVSNINEPVLDAEVTFSPNPVTNQVQIKVEMPDERFNLQLFDIQGNMLFQNEFVNQTELQMHHLPNGNYIIRIFSDKGATNKKIVKIN